MTKSEFKALIREEIKNTLNEETTFPIGVSNIAADSDRLIITIGNNSADLLGYTPKPAELKKLNSVMSSHLMAKRIKPGYRAEFDQGGIAYEVGVASDISLKDLMDVVKAVQALNMKHSY